MKVFGIEGVNKAWIEKQHLNLQTTSSIVDFRILSVQSSLYFIFSQNCRGQNVLTQFTTVSAHCHFATSFY